MSNLEVFGDIQLQSIPQQITSAIKALIYDGKLKPGDKLPKQEVLAQTFGVSRPTIREALRILAEQQWIVQHSGKDGGCHVSHFHPEQATGNVRDIIVLSLTFQTMTPWDLFEVRKMVEIPSAGLAAARRTEQDLERLEACLPPNDYSLYSAKELIEKDLQFHLILADCTRNPLAKTFNQAMIMSFTRVTSQAEGRDKSLIIRGLPELFDAVKRRDTERAEYEMAMHLNQFLEYYQLNKTEDIKR